MCVSLERAPVPPMVDTSRFWIFVPNTQVRIALKKHEAVIPPRLQLAGLVVMIERWNSLSETGPARLGDNAGSARRNRLLLPPPNAKVTIYRPMGGNS